jgi:hypothetical protein
MPVKMPKEWVKGLMDHVICMNAYNMPNTVLSAADRVMNKTDPVSLGLMF